jgi:amidohydrolase
MDKEAVLAAAAGMRDWLVDTRRKLHMIPEPGLEEHKTSAAIASALEGLGVEFEKRATAIVGIVRGARPGPTVAVRADMDALPIAEERRRSWSSTRPGFMHACGHDAHTTILLGVARFFSERRDSLAGTVKLLFQPAEETSGGAKDMIRDGCLENPSVDFVIGLHVMPHVPTGSIEVKYGALNGSSDTLHIAIKGKSSHGAYPDLGIDAIMISGHVVTALHSLVSRCVSPLDSAVLSIGTIAGGAKSNIIANEVTMEATLRTTDPAVEERLIAMAGDIVSAIPKAFGGSGELVVERGYRSLINHDRTVDAIMATAEDLLGKDRIIRREKPSMGVEDFSYFLNEREGAFYHLGCMNVGLGIAAPLHNGMFDIDEDCLQVGVAMQTGLVMRLLGM